MFPYCKGQTRMKPDINLNKSLNCPRQHRGEYFIYISTRKINRMNMIPERWLSLHNEAGFVFHAYPVMSLCSHRKVDIYVCYFHKVTDLSISGDFFFIYHCHLVLCLKISCTFCLILLLRAITKLHNQSQSEIHRTNTLHVTEQYNQKLGSPGQLVQKMLTSSIKACSLPEISRFRYECHRLVILERKHNSRACRSDIL